jgi:uncharacterized tellurite resistance protein B-like protein
VNIDTGKIRRLRDALVEGGRLEPTVDLQGDRPADRGRLAALDRVAPFVETMYLMMMVDGEGDKPEQEAIRGAMRVLTHGLLDDEVLEELTRRCEQQVRDQGIEARLQAIGSRICADRLDRETAFSLAAAMALADNKVVTEESLLVASIAEWFGVSGKRCRELLQEFEN